MQLVTDFQLIRYIDTTAVDLVAVCSKCRRAAVVDVWAVIDAEDANVWLGHIRERQQCQHCGARAAELYTAVAGADLLDARADMLASPCAAGWMIPGCKTPRR